MECTQCGHDNSPDAKFCGGCGKKMDGIEQAAATGSASCPQCGQALGAGKKFCPKCGASPGAAASIPGAPPPPPPPARPRPADSPSAAPPQPDHAAIQPLNPKRGLSKVVLGVIAAALLVTAWGGGYWYHQSTACGRPDREPTTAEIADYMNKEGYLEFTTLKSTPALCQINPRDISNLGCGKDPILRTAQGGAVLTCGFWIQNTSIIIRANDEGRWRMTTESVYPPLPESLCRPKAAR